MLWKLYWSPSWLKYLILKEREVTLQCYLDIEIWCPRNDQYNKNKKIDEHIKQIYKFIELVPHCIVVLLFF